MTDHKGFLTNKPFILKSIVLLFSIGIGIMLMSLILYLGGLIFFPGTDLLSPEVDVEKQLKNIDSTIFLQICSQVFLMLVPAIIFGYFMRNNGFRYLKVDKLPGWKSLIIAFLIVFLGGIVTQTLVEVNRMIDIPDTLLGIDLSGLEERFDYYQELNEELMDGFFSIKDPMGILAVFVMIAIVPAISEEFLFRGVIQQLLIEGRHIVFTGIIVTAVTFGLIHFQFYNFFGLVFMGVVLGYLFYYSGNLWLPIIAHFLNNGLQVILVYLYEFNMIEVDIDEVEHIPYWISAIAFIGLIYFLKVLKKHKAAIERLD
ncbi:MAG: CPBP family intramembrane metalloprotease [Chitinophagales bacterium]|nr:CPBP family intramembrane metalloprotease [Chitinophagales bacterium]